MAKMNWSRARKLDKSSPSYKEQRLDKAADNWVTGGSLDKQPVVVTKGSMDDIAVLRLLRDGPVNRDNGPIPNRAAMTLLGRGLLMLVTIYPQGYLGNRLRTYEITPSGLATFESLS
jgi:hypothetical protein